MITLVIIFDNYIIISDNFIFHRMISVSTHTSYCYAVTTKSLIFLRCIAHLYLINRISVQIKRHMINLRQKMSQAHRLLPYKYSSRKNLNQPSCFVVRKSIALFFLMICTKIQLLRDKCAIQHNNMIHLVVPATLSH